MRILVFLKQILDAESPFVITDEMEDLDGLFMPRIVDPADLCLLAAFRSAFPFGAAEIIAADVTLSESEEAARKGIAYGADSAVVVRGSGTANAESYRARGSIAAALMKQLEADVAAWSLNDEFLMLDGSPAFMAQELGAPLVSRVCSIDGAKDQTLLVHRKLDHGDREALSCPLPSVIVSDGSRASLPYPAFPQLLKSQHAKVEQVNLDELGIGSGSLGTSSGSGAVYLPPRPRPKRTPEKKKTGAARMASMMGGGAKKKTDNLVESDAATAAARIVEFLEEKNLLA